MIGAEGLQLKIRVSYFLCGIVDVISEGSCEVLNILAETFCYNYELIIGMLSLFTKIQ